MSVSVVVPTKDRPELLDEALASVRGQRLLGADLDLIVVDDGSARGGQTADVAHRHGARLVRHEHSRGVSAARNSGIAVATGTHLAFLDDDDVWAPTKLTRQLEAMADTGADWSATACLITDQHLAVVSAQGMPPWEGSLHDYLLDACWIPGGGSSVVARTELLARAGDFVEGVRGCEDWDMWVRLAALAPIAYVDSPLVAYRTWGGNVSGDLTVMQQGRDWILERHRPEGSAVSAQAAADWEQSVARTHVLNGRRVPAARAYLRAQQAGGGRGQWVYAAAALVWPPLVARRLARIDGAIPDQWRAEGEAWLQGVTAGRAG